MLTGLRNALFGGGKRPPSAGATEVPIGEKQPPEPAQKTPDFTGDDHITAASWRAGPKLGYVSADLANPLAQGLPVASAAELMEANRTLIEQALDAFQGKEYIEGFDDLIVEMVRRFAHWMGPMPASRQHHHSERGGLFTHSLGVAVLSLHMASTKNVTYEASPREKDAAQLAWQLACFVGGLLHDVGKLHTIGVVKIHSASPPPDMAGHFRSAAAPVYAHPWEPMVEGFERWSRVNRVQSYFIDFETTETMEHRFFTPRYVMALVPRQILAFIYGSTVRIRQQFEDFIRNPESGSRTPIFQVIQDADHMNVAQALDPKRRPGSVELEALVVRRFAEFCAEAPWNHPTAPVIYAHVQHESGSGMRFLGLPFFIATPSNIAALKDYIVSRPTFGVSFGDHASERIFNALEKQQYLARTIEKILPQQIVVAELEAFVPASAARVRFSARKAKDTNGEHVPTAEDVVLTLPVIPIRARPPSDAFMNGPILNFRGEPLGSAAMVFNLQLTSGRVQPEDPALINDGSFTDLFGEPPRIVNDGPRLTPEDLATLPSFDEPPQTAPAAVIIGDLPKRVRPAPPPTKAEGQGGPTSPNGSADNPATDSTEVANWLKLYDEAGNLRKSEPEAIGASLWCYLIDYPYELVTPRVDGDGHYSIEAKRIPAELRRRFADELTLAGRDASLLYSAWARNADLSVTEETTQRIFSVGNRPGGLNFFTLRPCATEILETLGDHRALRDLIYAAKDKQP